MKKYQKFLEDLNDCIMNDEYDEFLAKEGLDEWEIIENLLDIIYEMEQGSKKGKAKK